MLLRLLIRITSWFAPKPAKKPARSRPRLEPLESRIAPAATFVNAHLVTYIDGAGDLASVGSSLPIFTKTNFDSVLTFVSGTTSGTQLLQEINLTSNLITSSVTGESLSVTVHNPAHFVDVGAIESGDTIGKIYVQGNLGFIEAGSAFLPGASNYIGLGALTVHSLGSQANSAPTPSGNYFSNVYGGVGSITVQTNLVDAQLEVRSNSAGIASNGNVGSLVIGGSVMGGPDAMGGFIQVDGSVGSIAIGGNLQGNTGNQSGAISVGESVGSLSVHSIIGYTKLGDMTPLGQDSGSITIGGTLATSTTIGHLTVTGSVIGGEASGSGSISQLSESGGGFGTVKIGGSLTGGTGDNSGEISGNAIGLAIVGTGITGSSGASSGSISSTGGIGGLAILAGGITGGTNTNSGSVIASSGIGSALIHGDIHGNASALATVAGTGQIQAASISYFTLYGSLIGSTASQTGSLVVTGAIGHVALFQTDSSAGSLLGGAGPNSGEISGSQIGSVYIAGRILGSAANTGDVTATSGAIGGIYVGQGITGAGDDSGVISTSGGAGFGDDIGVLLVHGGITGGAGDNSGQVSVGGAIHSINLYGSALTGMGGVDSGGIFANDYLGSVSIGSIINGAGAGSGQLSTGGNIISLAITGGATATAVSGTVNVEGSVGSISVHGDIVGAGDSTGLFLIGGGIGSLSVSGALRGGPGDNSGSIFAGLDGSTGIVKASIGDMIGGGGLNSGSLISYAAIGTVSVTGSAPGVTTHGVIGGTGANSGQIYSGANITAVHITGDLKGDTGPGSGSVVTGISPVSTGQGIIGSIGINGSVLGGTGTNSGQVSAAGSIGVVAVSGNVTGNVASGSGAILAGTNPPTLADGNIYILVIDGSLQGANIPSSTGTVTGSGYIEANHIGTAVLGSIQAGSVSATGNTVTADGAILAAQDISTLVVTGANGIQGTQSNSVSISAVGQASPGKTDLAFGNITVAHGVQFANFLAGYDQTLTPVNSAASIGSIVVGGNWSGSNLIAGAETTVSNGPYGGSVLIDPTASVIPTIASIIIKGQVQSASTTLPQPPDTYGFVSGKIEDFVLHGVSQDVALGFIDPVGQSTDTVFHSLA